MFAKFNEIKSRMNDDVYKLFDLYRIGPYITDRVNFIEDNENE